MLKCLALLLAFATTAFAARTPTAEIEALIAYVGHLENVAFVRNGTAHTTAEAIAHLRLKWDRQKDDVRTAEDFIRLCATESSMSGDPYLIRFADGHEERCAQVLLRQLKVLRTPPAAPAAAPAHSGAT